MASTINAALTNGLIQTADTSGILQLQTAGTTALTINGSQNIGIGTASPTAKLEISDSVNGQFKVAIRNSNAGSSAYAQFLLGNDTSASAATISLNSSTNTALLGGANSLNIYQGLSAPISFQTSGTTKMTLDASGNLGIGITPNAWSGYKAIQIGQSAAVWSATGTTDTYFSNNYYYDGTNNKYIVTGFSAAYHLLTTGEHRWLIAPSGTAGTNITFTDAMTLNAAGNLGIGTNAPAYKLQVVGSFAATTKSFVIEHPTKPGYSLRYGSLEGPENGVYVRGKLTGKNTIELPDYWTKLVDPDSITVSLTPIGKHQKLYVENIENNIVTIANDNLFSKSINCFYLVQAERVDVEKLIVEII